MIKATYSYSDFSLALEQGLALSKAGWVIDDKDKKIWKCFKTLFAAKAEFKNLTGMDKSDCPQCYENDIYQEDHCLADHYFTDEPLHSGQSKTEFLEGFLPSLAKIPFVQVLEALKNRAILYQQFGHRKDYLLKDSDFDWAKDQFLSLARKHAALWLKE